jgi:hypothetical protein
MQRLLRLGLALCLLTEFSSADIVWPTANNGDHRNVSAFFTQSAIPPQPLFEGTDVPRHTRSLTLATAAFLLLGFVVSDQTLLVAQSKKPKGFEEQRKTLHAANSQFKTDWKAFQPMIISGGELISPNLQKALTDKAAETRVGGLELISGAHPDALSHLSQTIAVTIASDPKSSPPQWLPESEKPAWHTFQDAVTQLLKSFNALDSDYSAANEKAKSLGSKTPAALQQELDDAAMVEKATKIPIDMWRLISGEPMQAIYKSPGNTTFVQGTYGKEKGLITGRCWVAVPYTQMGKQIGPNALVRVVINESTFDFDIETGKVTRLDPPVNWPEPSFKTLDEADQYIAQLDFDKLALHAGEFAVRLIPDANPSPEAAPPAPAKTPPADAATVSAKPEASASAAKPGKTVVPSSEPKIPDELAEAVKEGMKHVSAFLSGFAKSPSKYPVVPGDAATGADILNNVSTSLPVGHPLRQKVEQMSRDFALVEDIFKLQAHFKQADDAQKAFDQEMQVQPMSHRFLKMGNDLPTTTRYDLFKSALFLAKGNQAALEILSPNYAKLSAELVALKASRDQMTKKLKDISPPISGLTVDINHRIDSIEAKFNGLISDRYDDLLDTKTNLPVPRVNAADDGSRTGLMYTTLVGDKEDRKAGVAVFPPSSNTEGPSIVVLVATQQGKPMGSGAHVRVAVNYEYYTYTKNGSYKFVPDPDTNPIALQPTLAQAFAAATGKYLRNEIPKGDLIDPAPMVKPQSFWAPFHFFSPPAVPYEQALAAGA